MQTKVRYLWSMAPSDPMAPPGPPFPTLDAARTLDDLLGELEQRRAADVAWVRGLSQGSLDAEGEHDHAGTFSARNLIHYWACHHLLHLRQVVRGLQDTPAPHVGNLTVFFED
jgi:hypothetical protein